MVKLVQKREVIIFSFDESNQNISNKLLFASYQLKGTNRGEVYMHIYRLGPWNLFKV